MFTLLARGGSWKGTVICGDGLVGLAFADAGPVETMCLPKSKVINRISIKVGLKRSFIQYEC